MWICKFSSSLTLDQFYKFQPIQILFLLEASTFLQHSETFINYFHWTALRHCRKIWCYDNMFHWMITWNTCWIFMRILIIVVIKLVLLQGAIGKNNNKSILTKHTQDAWKYLRLSKWKMLGTRISHLTVCIWFIYSVLWHF